MNLPQKKNINIIAKTPERSDLAFWGFNIYPPVSNQTHPITLGVLHPSPQPVAVRAKVRWCIILVFLFCSPYFQNSTIVLAGCLGPICVNILGPPAKMSFVPGDVRITYNDCVWYAPARRNPDTAHVVPGAIIRPQFPAIVGSKY